MLCVVQLAMKVASLNQKMEARGNQDALSTQTSSSDMRMVTGRDAHVVLAT